MSPQDRPAAGTGKVPAAGQHIENRPSDEALEGPTGTLARHAGMTFDEAGESIRALIKAYDPR